MTDHPIRGRLNAWLLDRSDAYVHQHYGELKAGLFRDAPSTVVELGAGSGVNMRYFPPGTRVVAIEPNVRMHPRLRRRAEQAGVTLDVQTRGAEGLPFASGSVEFIFATFVLCSVQDPAQVVREIRRVLAPGGRFVCIEHVMAPPGSRVAALQRAIRRPWRWLLEGCDLCNRTESVLRAGGFRSAEIQPLDLPATLLPIRYQIAATCVA
jgi:SAM-dependent methyltransferase